MTDDQLAIMAVNYSGPTRGYNNVAQRRETQTVFTKRASFRDGFKSRDKEVEKYLLIIEKLITAFDSPHNMRHQQIAIEDGREVINQLNKSL